MEKVLLLNPPGDKLYQRDMYCSAISKANYYWPPIDLLILSGLLKPYFDIDVLDCITEKLSPEKSLERITQKKYKAIIFLTGTASWKKDFQFLARIKKISPETLIIGNGDILLFKHQYFLEVYDFLDGVILDYTDSSIIDFLKKDFSSLRAFAWRENNHIVSRLSPSKEKEFSYPVPLHDKFPLKKYLLAQGKRFPFTTVQTSFGCPFHCTFCIASTLGFKVRSIENVIKELKFISSLGIKEVFFADFTFEARRKNTIQLCSRIIEEGIDLTWSCSSRANLLDYELLSLMKKAGCHTVLIGVESGEEKLLRKYSKGVTLAQIEQAFELCKKLKIRTLGHFIIGLPGETQESVKKTIELAKRLKCDLASFNIAVPPVGTKLRSMAVEKGWLKDEELEFDSSESYPVMETSTFSKEDAWKWRKKAVRSFYFRPGYLIKNIFTPRSSYEWRIVLNNGIALMEKYLWPKFMRSTK